MYSLGVRLRGTPGLAENKATHYQHDFHRPKARHVQKIGLILHMLHKMLRPRHGCDVYVAWRSRERDDLSIMIVQSNNEQLAVIIYQLD